MGKGSQLRPTHVSEAEAQRRWEQTFKRQAQPDTGSHEERVGGREYEAIFVEISGSLKRMTVRARDLRQRFEEVFARIDRLTQ